MNSLTIPLKGSSSCSNLQLPSLYATRPSKQIRIKKQKMMIGCASMQQKLHDRLPVVTMQQYNKWSSQQINSQYHDLKQQLRKIGDKLNNLIESKQVGLQKRRNQKMKSPSSSHLQMSKINSTVNDSTLNPSASVSTFMNNTTNVRDSSDIYQGYQKNNSKIFQNNRHELKKLLKREEFIKHSSNPNGLKEELMKKISQTKEEIKESKKNYKELMMESQKVGNDIVNTDELIEEIRMLEKQLNVLTLRKSKLQNLCELNNKNQQIIVKGSVSIVEKQSQLTSYQNEKKQSIQNSKTQQQLKLIMSKKLRTIAALKRDKQARNKISSKSYYELLTQLNEIQKRSQTYVNKFQVLETKIELTEHDCEDYKIEFDQLMARKKLIQKNQRQLQKSRYDNNERSFLTQIQNIQQTQDLKKSSFYKSKQNLQQNLISEKDMMKEIQENLQKTQKNLNQIESKQNSPRSLEVENEIDAIIDEQQEKQNVKQVIEKKNLQVSQKVVKNHNKKYSDMKNYQSLSDSQIVQQEQQLENSHEVQQLQQRFRENSIKEVRKIKA